MFNISVCISSPSGAYASQRDTIKNRNNRFSKIDASGRALKINMEFKYPVFDQKY